MRPRGGQGFTLLELLIALALMGIAMTIGFAALRLAVRSMESTDRLVDELEQLRVTRSVMQHQLSQARPLRESVTEQQVNFTGESQQLEFVAPAPAQGERLMGLYRYRLRFGAAGQQQGLVLEYQPYVPGPAQVWPAQRETELLMSGISEAEFSYFGASHGGTEAWQSRWSGEERLPRMVRLVMLRSGEDETPIELAVALPVERSR